MHDLRQKHRIHFQFFLENHLILHTDELFLSLQDVLSISYARKPGDPHPILIYLPEYYTHDVMLLLVPQRQVSMLNDRLFLLLCQLYIDESLHTVLLIHYRNNCEYPAVI